MTLTAHDDLVLAVALSHDEKLIASGAGDKKVGGGEDERGEGKGKGKGSSWDWLVLLLQCIADGVWFILLVHGAVLLSRTFIVRT